ncbi:MAG: choice-of-anchor tandem repeat GloVer-containing protein [Terriglobales bacterium]
MFSPMLKKRALQTSPVAVLFSFIVVLIASVLPVGAQTESVFYSFTGGGSPEYDLAIDGQGNLYGTTFEEEGGSVYKLTPSGDFTTLHTFSYCCDNDGNEPAGGVILDSKGNLYGATTQGGTGGTGTIFEISPSGVETILYNFTCENDGCFPFSGLVMDGQGNLYGTTLGGGAYYYGNVYKFVPSTGVVTTVYSFTGGNDGAFPFGVVLDQEGNLYGATQSGGTAQQGVVFKLTSSGMETVLHSFEPNGTDGFSPYATVTLDSKGNVYGTTHLGGKIGVGTVYKITPAGKETILHSFKGGKDGIFPQSDLTFDADGNLYGTTFYGGAYDFGTVFKIAKTKETVLHSFDPNEADGILPMGDVVFDQNGNLFGTTSGGGAPSENCPSGCGTVYKITFADGASTDPQPH